MALIDDIASSAGGSGFNNSILAGQGTLVRSQIQSPNYVPGVSGWIIRKDGTAEFRSIVVGPGTSISIFIQGPTPTANAVGDLWYDSTNGMLLHQWNGATWGPFSIGTGAIASGAITAALIAANTITAGQIAANTITATQLAAGIVYAGIVDATTITAATFNGGTFNGTNFTINVNGAFFYSGAPAAGNLIFSIANVAGTDAHGNAYLDGSTAYGSGATVAVQLSLGNVNVLNAASFAGPWTLNGGMTFTGTDAGGVEITGIGTGSHIAQLKFIGANTAYYLEGINTFLYAADPGTGLKEDWHNFSLVGGTSAGVDINGTSYPPAYKLLPDGNLAIRGVLVTGAGGLAANTTWAVIPAAYRPQTNIPTRLVSNANTSTLANVYVRPNGNMQFNNAIGGTINMYIDCIIMLNGA